MGITVIDVAKAAGVSRTTVSNVLNGKMKYTKETEEAVLTAAKKLGYKPNLAAKSLITNKSRLIGLVLPSYVDKNTLTNSPFYNIIFDGVYAALQSEAYYDLIIFCVAQKENLFEVSDWIDRRNVDGLIAIGEYSSKFIKELNSKSIPVVLIDSYQSGFSNFSYVNSNDEAGGYLATQKLIADGYKRIAYCTLSDSTPVMPNSPVMQKRYAGYQKAIHEAGYPEAIFEGEGMAFEAGKQLGETLYSQQIDGAFCTQDMLAIGVLQSLLKKGIRVGQEFGLVGFDNIQIGQQVYPQLTTIDQNIFEKGEIAIKKLMNILKGDEQPGTRLILPVQLVIRETTR